LRYKCSCCGYYTLIEKYDDICPVCRWQEDIVQKEDLDFKGGANEVSLNQARDNYKLFEVSDEKFAGRARKPLSKELVENNE